MCDVTACNMLVVGLAMSNLQVLVVEQFLQVLVLDQ